MRWIDAVTLQVPPQLESLQLHPLAVQTLARRGIQDFEGATAFLHPDQSASAPFPGMEEASAIIKSAIRKREKICVWGDFDVDGQTSTALLVQALRTLGADVSYYIPVRARESHGIHIDSLKPIIAGGVKLLLSCDTGITAHEAIAYARQQGLQVVVTDHHDPGGTLPNANAILNPKLLLAGNTVSTLAGVGVAYKLAEALLCDGPEEPLRTLLDLAALGLIADVALLDGETRRLAQLGIQQLRCTGRLGLKAIAELTGTQLDSLNEESIGFTFAPRLNALGRLSDANPAVELLLTQDPLRARLLASEIENLNAQRRLLTSQVYQAAEAQLQMEPGRLQEPAIILSHPNWPGGVVGIVASRLVERYNKPAILLSESEDGILRGSARSVEGLHITAAISSQSALLIGFGGHPMAAGLSLHKENLARFRKGLCRDVERQLGAAAQEPPTLEVDAWLHLEEIELSLVEALECLAPFGSGNPPLVFASRGVRLNSSALVGKNREHLRLNIADDAGSKHSIMSWNASEEALPEEGTLLDVAYSLRLTHFRGQLQISSQLIDLHVSEAQPLHEIRERALELVDFRHEKQPGKKLQELKQEIPALQVWAEGSQAAHGRRRDQLQPARALAVYTVPPSAAELRRVIKAASPTKVYIFAAQGAVDEAQAFLNQLAGLCKYAISKKDGRVALEELAAVTAQRLTTVMHGLEYLRAGGHIRFEGQDQIILSTGDGQQNTELQKPFLDTTRDLLEETAAFRRYYLQAQDAALLVVGPRPAR